MEFNLKPPYNGIAQDKFFWDNGECAYMENISNDQMRYATLSMTYALISGGNTGATTNVNQMVDTPAWVITCWDSKILLNWGDKSATLAGAKRHEYLIDTSGNQVNYFIDNSNVYETDYDVSTINDTEAHAWWSWTVTASCLVYNEILYARGSTILKYDTVTNTSTTLASDIPILTWSTVKYMYFYNDMVYIVTVSGYGTIIYQVQYSSSGYGIYGKEQIQGEVCVWAVGNGAIIYWITTTTIYWFSGTQSTFLRYIGTNNSFEEATFTSTPSLAYHNKFLYIAAWTTIWKYWSRYQWRRASLTIKSFSEVILGITGRYIQTQVTTNYIYTDSSKYPNSWIYITFPFDAGDYSEIKTDLKFRVGYQLTTWTSITIGVMTDAMEIANTTTYATVATLSDTTKRVSYIGIQEILTALGTNSPEWQYLRFKVTLSGWWGSSGLRDNTPSIYDITPVYEEAENNF